MTLEDFFFRLRNLLLHCFSILQVASVSRANPALVENRLREMREQDGTGSSWSQSSGHDISGGTDRRNHDPRKRGTRKTYNKTSGKCPETHQILSWCCFLGDRLQRTLTKWIFLACLVAAISPSQRENVLEREKSFFSIPIMAETNSYPRPEVTSPDTVNKASRDWKRKKETNVRVLKLKKIFKEVF